MASKLDAALALAAEGFKVFPIAPGKKAPPLLNGWPERASSDQEEVRQFWLVVPDANIGISCAGLVVVDVDVKKGGLDALARLDLTEGMPATRSASTPSGGKHLFYRLPDGVAVPNSVGSVASGIDIRSVGGYVVAAGSTIDAGTYAWENNLQTAPAPAWLVERAGSHTPRQAATAPVPDAVDPVVERAADWLTKQAPAIEGQGGDAQTFKVICGLRDRGVSSGQASDLLPDWNARCVPPWTPEELAVKVSNAYRYATGEPGSKAVLPDEFPIVPKTGTNIPKSSTAKAVRLADFAAQTTAGPGYLIKGLLQRRSYAELFGAPGEGKTFVALDLAYHVAAGKPWMGRKTRGGPVLYLAYEGIGGLVNRGRALRQRYGAADVPLYIAGAAFDLRDKAGRQALGQVIADMPVKPALVVIDTFARALMGGDENSAQDVGAFNSAVAALIESTGACVMIVHHSGKNKAAGARGSSALLGALDTELEVDNGQVIASKQRDVELGEPTSFKLVPIVVGVDEDGDEQTSCAVEPGQFMPASGPRKRLQGNAKRGFEALCDLAADNKPVEEAAWRTACKEFTGNRSASFWDLKRVLVRDGYVDVDDNGVVTRKMTQQPIWRTT